MTRYNGSPNHLPNN